MLSYRHSYHAGNHADVLKHSVLVALLRYLTEKDKRLWYIDTHAGAGMYRLDNNRAAYTSESRDGIERLWLAKDLPDAVQRYVDFIRQINPDGKLRNYPGSPVIAEHLLRAGDKLWLSELHSTDHATLDERYQHSRHVRVQKVDGFKALTGLLPPEPRRALVMIDPSYEVKSDYARVVDALRDAQRRFATGVYAVWYPMLGSREAESLGDELRAAAGPRWLDVRLQVRVGRTADAGLYGSGLFVLNPPHKLPDVLQSILPYLSKVLSQDEYAAYQLEHEIP